MKTTIYELLGMIKDNKAPQKIMFENKEWEWEEAWYDYKVVHKRENEADWSLFVDEMNEYYDGVKDYLNDEVEIIKDKPSEEIRKLQSEIDILTNKVEHYYSEVVSFRDKTRYLKDELNKLKEV